MPSCNLQIKKSLVFIDLTIQRCTTSAAGATTYGTCISTSECTSRSGSASGTCAAGFGVCCKYFLKECDKTIFCSSRTMSLSCYAHIF